MSEVVIVKGKVCEARRTAKTFKGKTGNERFYFSLKECEYESEDVKKKIKEAFKDSGSKFTPTWVKNIDDGFINLKTQFDLPVKYDNITYDSLEDCLDDGDINIMGAIVKVSITIKKDAVYPKAVVIIENGEAYNPFNDFE